MSLLLLAFAFAAVPQPPRDPQSAIEPRSEPGAGQKLMAKFVGDWEVTKTFYPRNGDPVRQTGACRQTLIHGGRFLRSEFTFSSPDGASTAGEGLLGFDAQTGLFTSVWTDARSTRMSIRQSRGKFDGREIVLFSASLGESREERRSRTVARLEDGGERLVHRQFGVAADGSERLVMELELKRKPAPASGK